jgi:hypothetical protein
MELYFHILYRAGRNVGIVCVAMIVIADDGSGVFMSLVGRMVAPTANGKPL